MGKIRIALGVILMLPFLFFAACGGSSGSSTTPETTPELTVTGGSQYSL